MSRHRRDAVEKAADDRARKRKEIDDISDSVRITEASVRASDEEIMTSEKKPRNVSDARWRIELSRRRRGGMAYADEPMASSCRFDGNDRG